jgi:hypothetical protein
VAWGDEGSGGFWGRPARPAEHPQGLPASTSRAWMLRRAACAPPPPRGRASHCGNARRRARCAAACGDACAATAASPLLQRRRLGRRQRPARRRLLQQERLGRPAGRARRATERRRRRRRPAARAAARDRWACEGGRGADGNLQAAQSESGATLNGHEFVHVRERPLIGSRRARRGSSEPSTLG